MHYNCLYESQFGKQLRDLSSLLPVLTKTFTPVSFYKSVGSLDEVCFVLHDHGIVNDSNCHLPWVRQSYRGKTLAATRVESAIPDRKQVECIE